MSLSDLASLGSFVSGFSVLVSLIFLYFQLRQVTVQVKLAEKSQQALIRQNRATRVVDINLRWAEPSLVDAMTKGQGGQDDLTVRELAQFRTNCMAMFFNIEDSYYQHKDGLLTDAAFASFVLAIRTLFSSIGMQVMWERARASFQSEFVEFINGIVAQATVAPTVDVLAQWTNDLAVKKARVAAN
jgi:hypothetical protein